MACQEMAFPDLFNRTLPETWSYRLQGGILCLYNKEGKLLMTLGKTD